MAFNYNIADILRINSDFPLTRAKGISPSFDCFSCEEKLSEYDLVIAQKEFDSKKIQRYQRVACGLFYSKKENSLVSEMSMFGIRLFWEIKDLFNGKTHLFYNRAYREISERFLRISVSSVNPLFLLIRNILQLKLIQKKSFFLLGSALETGGQGCIFTGTTGAGKTTTLLSCMDHSDACYLCDDLMVLTEDKIYGILSPIVKRGINFGLWSVSRLIDPSQKYRHRILESINTNPDVFFLEKSNEKRICEIPAPEALAKLVAINNRIHPYFYERTLSMLPYLNHEFSLLNLQKESYDILRNSLKKARFFELRAPGVCDNTELLLKEFKLKACSNGK